VTNRRAYLILSFLGSLCVSVATLLQPLALAWSQRGQDSVIKVLLGDGRRLFANHFFTKADVYLHSGYYPTIFDKNTHQENHLSGGGAEHGTEADHDEDTNFMGKPKDWVERFGRHFIITEHTHLEHGQEREILPWLKLSAELDPQRVDTYTVAAYWLANRLGNVPEAEKFLREGLRANPKSYEILFSLGRLYYENDHDIERARNVWMIALRCWQEQEPSKSEPDKFSYEAITVNLARLEESQGNFGTAIEYLEKAQKVSPAKGTLQSQIDELRLKLPSTVHSAAHIP
jgi:tetratricopeptide (TPR) repeat protein